MALGVAGLVTLWQSTLAPASWPAGFVTRREYSPSEPENVGIILGVMYRICAGAPSVSAWGWPSSPVMDIPAARAAGANPSVTATVPMAAKMRLDTFMKSRRRGLRVGTDDDGVGDGHDLVGREVGAARVLTDRLRTRRLV